LGITNQYGNEGRRGWISIARRIPWTLRKSGSFS
jgi:hypothetical protein